MRVVCDNCGATYRIPDHKLVREVNKATCRKCGHGIIIRKAGASGGAPSMSSAHPISPDDATQIASAAEIEARARSGSGRGGTSPSGFGAAVGSEGFEHSSSGWTEEDNGAETVVSSQDAEDSPASGDVRGEKTAPWEGLSPSDDANIPTADPEPGLPSFGPGSLPAAPGPAPQSESPGVPLRPSAAVPRSRSPRQMSRAHDPSADLAVVLGGAFVALLAVIFLVTSPDPGIHAMALFAAFAGLLTAIFLIATSKRGREEGKPVVSILLALALSSLVTFLFHSQGSMVQASSSLPQTESAAAVVSTTSGMKPPEVKDPGLALTAVDGEAGEAGEAESSDLVIAAEPEPEPESKPEPKSEPKPKPEPVPEPVREPSAKSSSSTSSRDASTTSSSSAATTTTSSPSSSKSSSSSSSSKSSSGSSSSKSSRSSSGSSKSSSKSSRKASRKSEASSSSQPTAKGVPLTVLDTMVKNNRRVKSCFGVYKEKTGSLPSGRIPVKIAIEPSGVAYKVWINGGAYAGTTLDRCVGSAIKTIAFPPFSGESQTYNYLFVF